MTKDEAITVLKANYPDACYSDLRRAVDVAIEELEKQIPVKNAPTADVEEVVWCKDCRYCVGLFSCNKNEEQLRHCQRFGLHLIDGNGYCFWGERPRLERRWSNEGVNKP